MKTCKRGKIEVVADRREIFLNGREVPTTLLEFRLFNFIRDAKRLLTRQEIISELWNDGAIAIDTRTVDQHIARLRRKLGRDVILTVPGSGYKIAL